YEGPTEPLLRELVFGWWEQYGNTTAGGISKLMMAESGNFPEVARFFLNEVIEPSHALVEAVIERGIKRREFRRVDVRTHVEVMIAPLVMLCLWQHSFGPCSAVERNPQRYLETLVEVFLTSLRATPPAAGKRTTARKTNRA
ncbi:MAG TPA: TetR-like C-terminal domain-containing protein, partial [Burkholderiaceae bacterium]|nr:TetR-like C-terminal domain-containing protein [Burkholderiaceae bacterium]